MTVSISWGLIYCDVLNSSDLFTAQTYFYRVLSRSREPAKIQLKDEEVEERLEHERLQKAIAAQWLCFSPPPGLESAELLRVELLARAVQHRFHTKY